MSSFGSVFRASTFGESHGGGVGVVIDGVPPCLELTESDIQPQLTRRRPGAYASINTARNEADKVKILSGTEHGRTLGTPIACLVHNKDHRPQDYKFEAGADQSPEMLEVAKNRQYIFRPSHADFTYWEKYGTHSSSGGGRSSARETIGRVIAGTVGEKFLSTAVPGFQIVAFVSRVGDFALTEEQKHAYIADTGLGRAEVDRTMIRCPDVKLGEAMQTFVADLKTKGDSVGGEVTCVVRNCPRGLGEPAFDKLEAMLAHAMLSIPATKGFAIGSGFKAPRLRGSAHNDAFHVDASSGEVRTRTNNSGGIQGGISNGEPIYFDIAFKPPATIAVDQMSVNKLGEETLLKCKGRHDPCIVNRAVPIVEAMTALVLTDMYLVQAARKAAQSAMLAGLPRAPGSAQPTAAATVPTAPMPAPTASTPAPAPAPAPAPVAQDITSVGRADVLRPVLGQNLEVPPEKYLHALDFGNWRDHVRRLTATKTTHVLILCDTVVHRLYKQQIQSLLDDRSVATREFHVHVIPSGEPVKHICFKAEIEDKMLSLHFPRGTSKLVALGGGVVGDLGGFVAATYARGIPVIQVPTTILSMVDSALGGKVAIDIPGHGKNLVGNFHLPLSTVVDTDTFLETLPRIEFTTGLGEVIKTALIIADPELWTVLKANTLDRLIQDKALQRLVVELTARAKMRVCSADSKDTKLTREVLNFGHTVGHAIEAETCVSHGLCVSVGCVQEMSAARCRLPEHARLEILNTMAQYEMPVHPPKNLDLGRLLKYLKNDKKMGRVVSISDIGKPLIFTPSQQELELMLTNQRRIETAGVPIPPVPGTQSEPIVVDVPASKSITNRAIILAALADPQTSPRVLVKNCLFAEDTMLLVQAMGQLGVDIRLETETKTVSLVPVGRNLGCLRKDVELHLGNSGTCVRFLTGVLGLLGSETHTICGVPRMKKRPIKPLLDALRPFVACEKDEEARTMKMRIHGASRTKDPASKRIVVDTSVSSQFLSGLIMALPLLGDGYSVYVKPGGVSKTFVQMTLDCMRAFGGVVEAVTPDATCEPGSTLYVAKTYAYDCVHCPLTGKSNEYAVEPDASAAMYPIAMGFLLKRHVIVPGLQESSLQGDCAMLTRVESFNSGRPAGTPAMRVHIDERGMHVEPTSGEGASNGCHRLDLDSSDTTLTFGVLAGLSNEPTIISNIANQNVKECDRVNVVVNMLLQCGVRAVYGDDEVLRIEGLSANHDTDASDAAGAPAREVLVRCKNDHRVAMTAAVLAVGLKAQGICHLEIAIDDLRCVDKTYPTFWKDMNTKFGLDVAVRHADNGVHDCAVNVGTDADTNTPPCHPALPPICLLGLPGSGKSALAGPLATQFGLELIDVDAEISKRIAPLTISDLTTDTAKHPDGFQRFRDVERDVLVSVLARSNVVVDCGGGAVEHNADIFRNHVVSIWVKRPVERVWEAIAARTGFFITSKAQFEEVRARREPLYHSCCHLTFINDFGDLGAAEEAFCRFFRGVARQPPAKPGSQFMCLPGGDAECREILASLTADADGGAKVDYVEVRADLIMEDSGGYAALAENDFDVLQRRLDVLPDGAANVIFTVRSKVDGGVFTGSQSQKQALVDAAARRGCAIVDVEALHDTFEVPRHGGAEARGRSSSAPWSLGPKVLLSSHTDDFVALKMAFLSKRCTYRTQMWAYKIVTAARNKALVEEFVAKELTDFPTCVIYRDDAMSRVSNRFLTPVCAPGKAVFPGQLDLHQVKQGRKLLNVTGVDRLEFLLAGNPIYKSTGPLMHNAWFAARADKGGANRCYYDLLPTEDVAIVVARMRDHDNTRGMSITMPLKEQVGEFCDEVSADARAIGAVNTLYKKADGTVHATNTDWLALRDVLQERILPGFSGTVAVLGAGGTARAACYTLQHLGVEFTLIAPRTKKKAEALQKEFGKATACLLASEIEPGTKFSLLLCTIPPEASVDEGMYEQLIDFGYCAGQPRPRTVVSGPELLKRQARHQFQLWEEHSLFENVVADAIRSNAADIAMDDIEQADDQQGTHGSGRRRSKRQGQQQQQQQARQQTRSKKRRQK